jgi:DNA-binding transcriptional ArsR family regulator
VIAERLGVPASSLSFHLAQLSHAGLILQQREGRSLIYSADFAAMNALMGYLSDNCCRGASGCAPTTGDTGAERSRRSGRTS